MQSIHIIRPKQCCLLRWFIRDHFPLLKDFVSNVIFMNVYAVITAALMGLVFIGKKYPCHVNAVYLEIAVISSTLLAK